MPSPLATMFTFTTYGTWLRGDARGWVEEGITWPAAPTIESADRRRMKHPPFHFDPDDLLRDCGMIGPSLRERLDQRVLALTVQTWHVHFVVAASPITPDRIAKCAARLSRNRIAFRRKDPARPNRNRTVFFDAKPPRAQRSAKTTGRDRGVLRVIPRIE